MAKKQFLEIGQIVNTHGLKGDVKVDPWCDGPEFICEFDEFYLKDGSTVEVERARVQKNSAIVKLKGVDTIEQADLMRRTVLFINRDDVELDDDVFFIQDILGCEVRDADTDKLYGKITNVLKTGANDVYELKNDEGREFLIPVIDEVVIGTDIDKGVITIRPMKGIFDDED